MPLFVVTWTDKPGALPLRMATREAHLTYMADYKHMVRLGGPYLGPNGDLVGTLMIIEAESLEVARAFHAGDPYTKAGIYDHSDVLAWKPMAGPIT